MDGEPINLLSYEWRDRKTRVATWLWQPQMAFDHGSVHLGRLDDGRWWVSYGRHEYAYPDEPAARAAAARVMAWHARTRPDPHTVWRLRPED